MRRALLALLLLAPLAAHAEPPTILSAGAVEPGLAAALAATSTAARVTYATAPRLRDRLAAGERPNLLIGPADWLAELAAAGRLAGPPRPIGQVGVGIALRPGAPAPVITDAASLRAALLAADAVVFNRASTGLYLERLLARLGIAETVNAKSRRHATGAEVMEDLLRGSGAELGFGALTEILLFRDRGLRLLGPLPAELQNTTRYAAAVPGGGETDAGAALLTALTSPAALAAFAAAGVAP